MRSKTPPGRTAPQPRSQFQAEPRGDARIFWRRPVRAQGDPPPSDRPGDLLTFSTDLPASVVSMRPFAGARPHGHPPLSLEAAKWRPLFYVGDRLSLFAAQSFRSSGSAAASAISPSVSIGPGSSARSAAIAANPCTGQSRSRSNGWSRPPCPGLGSGQVQPSTRASGEPGRGRSRSAAILLKLTGGSFVPCRVFPRFRLS